jgi:hypothetical protein
MFYFTTKSGVIIKYLNNIARLYGEFNNIVFSYDLTSRAKLRNQNVLNMKGVPTNYTATFGTMVRRTADVERKYQELSLTQIG